jgi:DNA-binding NarL/FixJ family response regulator
MVRILIADDHDVVRAGLRAVLEGQPGWTVVGEARDGRSAIDMAVQAKPDVVILDYSMPLMNGGEATRQIRARLPDAEVLIFTAHDSETLLREVLQAGARGYLLKSEARSHLIAAIVSLAAHRPFMSASASETLVHAYIANGDQSALTPLTSREKRVVQLIAEGHPNRRISDLLRVSVKTVESHRASAMRKLSYSSTADLIRYALRNKLVEP